MRERKGRGREELESLLGERDRWKRQTELRRGEREGEKR